MGVTDTLRLQPKKYTCTPHNSIPQFPSRFGELCIRDCHTDVYLPGCYVKFLLKIFSTYNLFAKLFVQFTYNKKVSSHFVCLSYSFLGSNCLSKDHQLDRVETRASLM